MPAIATLALILGVLAATPGIFLFCTAWPCRDEVALTLGRELARAGRWIGGAGLGIWFVHRQPVSYNATLLLVIGGAAVLVSCVTKARPTKIPGFG